MNANPSTQGTNGTDSGPPRVPVEANAPLVGAIVVRSAASTTDTWFFRGLVVAWLLAAVRFFDNAVDGCNSALARAHDPVPWPWMVAVTAGLPLMAALTIGLVLLGVRVALLRP